MMSASSARRKIIYLTGTRADFGLMRATLQEVARVADLSLAVTGMHLAGNYGQTMEDIRATGLRVCGEIPVDVETRTPQSMASSIGACLMGLSALLQR